MSRLIDADKLIERFNAIAEGKIERIKGVNCESLDDAMSKVVKIAMENGERVSFQQFIDEQPTAYDVEEVAEKLEKSAKLYSLSDRDCEFAIVQNVALEIVKAGGEE